MTQFEFVSVFISIIFGLGLTLVLTGAIERLYQRRTEFLQVCYTIHTLIVATVAWWTLFQARDDPWTFELFFISVMWALCLFGMCAAIAPPGEAAKQPFEKHRRLVLTFFVAMGCLDIVQTAVADAWSWAYVALSGHTIVLTLLAIFIRNAVYQRFVAVYLPVSLLFWAFVVRRLLG